MNCLKCGSQITSDQNFCRSCGAGLPTNAIALSGESGISRVAKMRRFGIISIFAGLGIALTGKMLFHLDLVVYIGVLMNFLGMFLIVYPSVAPPRRTKSVLPTFAKQETLTPAETTKKLTPVNDIDFIPSVTEGTTNLLKISVPTAIETKDLLP